MTVLYFGHIGSRLNPRPHGAFPDPARRWGEEPPTPSAICQTHGPILDPKTTFDSSGLDFSEYVSKFYLNDTGRIKGQIFEYPALLASPGKSTVSSWKKACVRRSRYFAKSFTSGRSESTKQEISREISRNNMESWDGVSGTFSKMAAFKDDVWLKLLRVWKEISVIMVLAWCLCV